MDTSMPCECVQQAVRIVAERSRRFYFLEPSFIDVIEADGNYLNLLMGRESYITRCTIRHMLKLLDGRQFIRIHKSTIINIGRVMYVEREVRGAYVFVLHTGARYRCSATYHKDISELFGNQRLHSSSVLRGIRSSLPGLADAPGVCSSQNSLRNDSPTVRG